MNWKDYEPDKRVVCVLKDGYRWMNPHINNPEHGKIYTIRENMVRDERLGLLFVEIVNKPQLWDDGIYEPCFNAIYFRPVDETRLDVFRSMLTNLPKLPVLEYQT